MIGRESGTVTKSEGVEIGIVIASASGGTCGKYRYRRTIGVGVPPSTGDGEDAGSNVVDFAIS